MVNKYIDLTYCVVCGYDFEEPLDSDEDCPCCGIHVGYSKPSSNIHSEHQRQIEIEGAHEYRQQWLDEKAAKWDSAEDQPKGWNKEMALAQIKANVPEEFQ